MPTDDVERIAAGLSEAQKRLILASERGGWGRDKIVVIDGGGSLTKAMVEAVLAGADLGPVIVLDADLEPALKSAEEERIAQTYEIDEMVERMKILPAYYVPPRKRDHPTSPKQRGGR